ncbi:hypothetical protein [Aeoliella mucimassa]|uniref:DUF4190 domain-containing protein n=1 Tax=Aeoliella mucimassa TaxID=2527972 RepID=A0A518AWC9_9BACT|nr:hypothetical protein [Aeoliella mucimassa]QDU59039.1 hypothetical protein Pan181_52800 [Aeoliella mucimassa]
MSTTLAEPLPETDTSAAFEDATLQYRALHSGALIAALLGFASLFMLAVTDFIDVAIAAAVVPVVGIVASLMALKKIKNNSDIYTGQKFALLGLVLSFSMLCWGVGWASYKHATEVPEGYGRISFSTLQPSQKDEEAGRAIPKEITDVLENGEPVFIKGYIRPGSSDSRSGATQFLLVRDNNTCCFGDLQNVKYFDQVLVTLSPGLTADTDLSVTRLGGRLVCYPQNFGTSNPVYGMMADYIE